MDLSRHAATAVLAALFLSPPFARAASTAQTDKRLAQTDASPAPVVAPPPAQPDASPTPDAATAARSVLLEALNDERTKNNVAVLSEDPSLDAIADKFARDMVARNFFSHVTPEGLSPFDRMNRAGYKYGYAGEIIAVNSTPANAAYAFSKNADDRENVLSVHFKRVGFGTVVASDQVYVVEEFSD